MLMLLELYKGTLNRVRTSMLNKALERVNVPTKARLENQCGFMMKMLE